LEVTAITTRFVTVGGVDFELPFADLFPPLSAEVYEGLKLDISRRGIQNAIHVNKYNEVVDGQHRLLIAKELGLTDVPLQFIEEGQSRSEELASMRDLCIALNAHRRQLDAESRSAIVSALKESGLSNRAIAERVRVDEKTVRNDLKCSGAEKSAPEHPEKTTGSDGKQYPVQASAGTVAKRRERVAEAKAEGRSVREIAAEVGVSVGTVAADLAAVPEEPAADPEPAIVAACEYCEASTTDPETPGWWWDDDAIWTCPGCQAADRAAADEIAKEAVADEPALSVHLQEAVVEPDDRVNETNDLKPQVPGLKALRQSPDLWHIVDESGELYGIIERGSPRAHSQSSFVGHALIPWDNHPLEAPLSYSMSGDGSYPSLKSVVEDIEKALQDPDSFWRGHESVRNFHSRCYTTREKETYHGGSKSIPSEPFHDIDLDGEGWKEEDLQTSSLWIFKSRAKGEGRRGDYHGNFIPQIPDQVLRRYTRAGDVVLDLFAGSGTTAIEAKRLGRHFVGVDLNMDLADRYIEIRELPNPHNVKTKIFWGNSASPFVYQQIQRYLRSEHEKEYADHVILHPPYWDIIKFGKDFEADKDLSQCKTLTEFLDRFQDVAWRALKILRPGKYLTLVIGDTYRSGCWVPLAPYCMDRVMSMGLTRMKARNVKNMAGNEKGSGGSGAGLQAFRAIRDGTSTFGFEEVLIFQKAVQQ